MRFITPCRHRRVHSNNKALLVHNGHEMVLISQLFLLLLRPEKRENHLLSHTMDSLTRGPWSINELLGPQFNLAVSTHSQLIPHSIAHPGILSASGFLLFSLTKLKIIEEYPPCRQTWHTDPLQDAAAGSVDKSWTSFRAREWEDLGCMSCSNSSSLHPGWSCMCRPKTPNDALCKGVLVLQQ